MDEGQLWKKTCEEAVKAVVTILFYRPRPFDTESAGASEATGFVVDAKRGIILTNRVSSVFKTLSRYPLRYSSMYLVLARSLAGACFPIKKRFDTRQKCYNFQAFCTVYNFL
jgi:hypothetical protein